MALLRLYFIPGMFGFGRLASYDYFTHVEKALTARLTQGGHDVETTVLDVAPTASIRRRAASLAECVDRTSRGHGPGTIHLVGHSTGGLDARLAASPSSHLPCSSEALSWIKDLRSVTTLSTPHYGTPMGSFFATVSGQRALYALSALTYIALSIGSPPLAAVSSLIMTLGRLDRALGIARLRDMALLDLPVLESAVDGLLRVLGDARSREVHAYLDAIKQDQGAVIQVTPEAMDLFQAGVEDRAGVHYQSTASMAPPPKLRTLAQGGLSIVTSPYRTLSSVLFAALYGITSRHDPRYPCAPHKAIAAHETVIRRAFGKIPGVRENDGVVPLHSQPWGKLVWAGYADHLDVLGHFHDEKEGGHSDWMTSHADFDRARFATLMDAVAEGILGSLGETTHYAGDTRR